jgi:hypothetical protein
VFNLQIYVFFCLIYDLYFNFQSIICLILVTFVTANPVQVPVRLPPNKSGFDGNNALLGGMIGGNDKLIDILIIW